MIRRLSISLLFLFQFSYGFSFFSTYSQDSSVRPNILVIVADDLGWNDIGYHGGPGITPTLDSLARNGVELDRFYVHPSCSPTRSSLLTGKAALRLGMLTPLGKNNKLGLPLRERTLPEFLKESGYSTSLIGKWHLGRYKSDYWPNNRGFDHFYGYLTGGIGHYDHVHGGGLDWQRNGESLDEQGYSTHLLTSETLNILRNQDRSYPFYLQLCYAAPHLPNEAPEETINEYVGIEDYNRRTHLAMVTEIDRGVKKIVDLLKEQSMLENTIIWFFSDNGGQNESSIPNSVKKVVENSQKVMEPPFPITFLEFARSNLKEGASDNSPLRQGKGSVYEGGIRVPSFIHAPAFLEPKKVDKRVSINDVFPTILEAAQIDDHQIGELDGRNQWSFLKKNIDYQSSDFITHGTYGAEAYIKDSMKLVVPSSGPNELYNIYDDPHEQNNLISSHAEIANDLLNKLKSFPRGKSVHDPLWTVIKDPDVFGGDIDRISYAGLEGNNSGPISPWTILFISVVLLFGLSIYFLLRFFISAIKNKILKNESQ